MKILIEPWPCLISAGNVVLQRLLGRIGDDHVKGVVDDRALSGERVIVLHHLRQFHADVLGRERRSRWWCRRMPPRRSRSRTYRRSRCPRPRAARYGRGCRRRRAAPACRARRSRAARRQPAADGCDGLTGDGDIGLEHVARGRDASAANEEVVGRLGHGKLSGLHSHVLHSPHGSTDRAVTLPCVYGADSGSCLLDGMVVATILAATDVSSAGRTRCPGRAFSSSIPIPTQLVTQGAGRRLEAARL